MKALKAVVMGLGLVGDVVGDDWRSKEDWQIHIGYSVWNLSAGGEDAGPLSKWEGSGSYNGQEGMGTDDCWFIGGQLQDLLVSQMSAHIAMGPDEEGNLFYALPFVTCYSPSLDRFLPVKRDD